MERGAKDRLLEAAVNYKDENDFLKVLNGDGKMVTLNNNEDVTYTGKDGVTVLMELARDHDWLAAVTDLLRKVDITRGKRNDGSLSNSEVEAMRLLGTEHLF